MGLLLRSHIYICVFVCFIIYTNTYPHRPICTKMSSLVCLLLTNANTRNYPLHLLLSLGFCILRIIWSNCSLQKERAKTAFKAMHSRASLTNHSSTRMHACIHTYIHTYIHTNMHACLRTCVCSIYTSYIYMYIHTDICIQAYIYTCIWEYGS